jgi:hypothetical protein
MRDPNDVHGLILFQFNADDLVKAVKQVAGAFGHQRDVNRLSDLDRSRGSVYYADPILPCLNGDQSWLLRECLFDNFRAHCRWIALSEGRGSGAQSRCCFAQFCHPLFRYAVEGCQLLAAQHMLCKGRRESCSDGLIVRIFVFNLPESVVPAMSLSDLAGIEHTTRGVPRHARTHCSCNIFDVHRFLQPRAPSPSVFARAIEVTAPFTTCETYSNIP